MVSESRRQKGQDLATSRAGKRSAILDSLLLHLQESVECGVVIIRDSEKETPRGTMESIDVHRTRRVNCYSEVEVGVSQFQFLIKWVRIIDLRRRDRPVGFPLVIGRVEESWECYGGMWRERLEKLAGCRVLS